MKTTYKLTMMLITSSNLLSATENSQANNAAFYKPIEISNEENYWTEEKIKNAIPHPTPTVSQQKLKELLIDKTENSSNQNKSAAQNINDSHTLLPPPGEPTPANVYTNPYATGGALFFTKPDGLDYICTAQFTGKKNVLLTAAHCVRDGNTGIFYTNFRFHRAYSNGGGQFVDWSCMVTDIKWFNPAQNYRYDYAFIQTQSDSEAGWMGLKTEIPYYDWTAIGYPDNYGSNKYMYEVDGNKGHSSAGIVQMVDNPMGPGSSGGAWFAESSQGNFAIGLNSFRLDVDPESLYGPLFDDQFINLYDKAVNNCK